MKADMASSGTSPAIASTPNEQIGYIASEEYASRLAMPRSPSTSSHQKAHSNHSQTHVESPLRKTSFQADLTGKNDFNTSSSTKDSKNAASEHALESENEEDVIHIEPPSRPFSKIGGGGYDPPTEDLGPHGGNTEEEGGFLDERGYGTPILASDEVAKEPNAEFLQPAIEPHQERRGNDYYAGVDSEYPASYMSGHVRNGSRGSSVAGSRPTSRAGSNTGVGSGLSRFASRDDRDEIGTPLEDVEEYEPLFPEDDKEGASKGASARPTTAADRLKRHNITKHKFPSQDIWEDTPSSAQLQATVSTPDLPIDDAQTAKEAPTSGPTGATEEGSHQQGESEDVENASFLETKPHFPPHLREDRPGSKQRFPSRDIWEDTPSSLELQTTVTTPQTSQRQSPPTVPRRPTAGAETKAEGKASQGEPLGDDKSQATTGSAPASEKANAKPQVPSRPSKAKDVEPSETSAIEPSVPARPSRMQTTSLDKSSPKPSPTDRKGPSLPDRPKPHVPSRPTKFMGRESTENIPLSNTTSASSAKSFDSNKSTEDAVAPSPKPKPAVPLRPSGGKIASLKAGFMSDLDKRLQLGPQGNKPKEKDDAENEEEKEAVPLTDARKGRARGPARRKPAASPSKVPEEAAVTGQTFKLEVVSPCMVWQIDDDGTVNVLSDETNFQATSTPSSKAAQNPTPTLATNTAGEAVHSPVEVMSDGAGTATLGTSQPGKPRTQIVEAASMADTAALTPKSTTKEAPQDTTRAADSAAADHVAIASEVPMAPKHATGGAEDAETALSGPTDGDENEVPTGSSKDG